MAEVIFGPVPSRRLGISLGIDLVPFKTCSLDCIYCELGRTAAPVAERREYIPFARLEKEIRAFFRDHPDPGLDCVTLSGSGEPTLNRALPQVIELLGRLTPTRLALLTNGTLFSDPAVRCEVAGLDLILPSLDTVSEDIFKALNRPAAGLSAAGLVRGLAALRREFKGEIWLEILFCRGLNDHPAEIARLAAACQAIKPDRIQLNTVARPGALPTAVAVSRAFLEKILPRFGDRAEIIASFKPAAKAPPALAESIAAILATLKRRPCTATDLEEALGLKPAEIIKILDLLREKGEITAREHAGRTFYSAGHDKTCSGPGSDHGEAAP
jgi:wyosine [tRNA(Phe)-imidazoG37] synthetase (radical SAM superfamily)